MVTSDDHFHHASIQFKPTMAEIVTTYGGAITFRKKWPNAHAVSMDEAPQRVACVSPAGRRYFQT
jgi:hypothetical protein